MAASPLTYPTGAFQPFTKILSSEVNGKFTAISTLLNITKLSDTNVQTNGLSWDRLTLQTASKVAVTDTLGQLTVAAFVTPAQGGFGFSITPTTLDVNKVLQVNTAGTGLTFGSAPEGAASKIFSFYRFG